MEAIASGCPIVAFGAGGTPEVIEGGAGIIVETRNSKMLCSQTMNVLEDSKLRLKLSSEARKRAETRLTWDIAADKFEKVYKSLP